MVYSVLLFDCLFITWLVQGVFLLIPLHEKATAALTTLVTGKPDVTQASELHTSAKVNLVFTISLPHRNLENPVVCTGSRLNAEFASRSVLHRCFTGLRLHVTASQGKELTQFRNAARAGYTSTECASSYNFLFSYTKWL